MGFKSKKSLAQLARQERIRSSSTSLSDMGKRKASYRPATRKQAGKINRSKKLYESHIKELNVRQDDSDSDSSTVSVTVNITENTIEGVCGDRVVDIKHFLQCALDIGKSHGLKCLGHLFVHEEEQLSGRVQASLLRIRCRVCQEIFEISTHAA